MQAGKDSATNEIPENPVAQGLNNFLSSWFTDEALYQIVVGFGLLVLLVLIYLICRFLIFRPIARSRFASKSVGAQPSLQEQGAGEFRGNCRHCGDRHSA